MKKSLFFTILLFISMMVWGQVPESITKLKFTHDGTEGVGYALYTVQITEPVELTLVSDSDILTFYYINDGDNSLQLNVPKTILLLPGNRFSLEFAISEGSQPYFFSGLSTGFIGDFAPEKWSIEWSVRSILSFETVLQSPPCLSRAKRNNFEWIQEITIDEYSNVSGKEEDAYGDFTESSIFIDDFEEVQISLTPGYKNNKYIECWRVWIDLNNDGDYNDDGEMVFQIKGKGTVNGSFNLPDGFGSPEIKMKVAMRWKKYPPFCGSYSNGEVEEYKISIGL